MTHGVYFVFCLDENNVVSHNSKPPCGIVCVFSPIPRPPSPGYSLPCLPAQPPPLSMPTAAAATQPPSRSNRALATHQVRELRPGDEGPSGGTTETTGSVSNEGIGA